MVHDIDFLPESYRQQRQRREKTVWRRAVLAVFLMLIVLGTFRMRDVRSDLDAQRIGLQQQANRTVAQLQDADEVRRRIEELDVKANLITHLRIQASPTRLLAVITGCLPRFVTLTDYTSAYESIASGRESNTKPPRHNSGAQSQEEESAEVLDLQALRKRDAEKALILFLEGLAPNGVDVSTYLLALERADVFDEVTLLSNDPHPLGDAQLRRFKLRLRVRRPGAIDEKTNTHRPARPSTVALLPTPPSRSVSVR